MKFSRSVRNLVLVSSLAAAASTVRADVGTAFTYQGVLSTSGEPLNDSADFRFTLWNAAQGGSQQGSSVPVDNLFVTDGMFTTLLDFGVDPYAANQPRWLQIQVRSPAGQGSFQTLQPRQPLTPTPFSLATRGIHVRADGNVGLGTSNPGAKLEVTGPARAHTFDLYWQGRDWAQVRAEQNLGGVIQIAGPSGNGFRDDPGVELKGAVHGGGQILAYNASGDATLELDADSGNRGAQLLMSNGSAPTVHVNARGDRGDAELVLKHSAGFATVTLDADYGNFGSMLALSDSANKEVHKFQAGNHIISTYGDGGERIRLWGDRWGSIFLWDESNDNTVSLSAGDESGGEVRLRDKDGNTTLILDGDGDGNGTGYVTTGILRILGGSDLSEQFDIQPAEGGTIEPGLIVSIDPTSPGNLVVSTCPYDQTVAGIVSGAGGVRPGMLMGQAGSVADGDHPVALTGRVWARCDASNGAIEPGDLLTTSARPGHAMKVTDQARARGAIIGKAMTALAADTTGLVLVLVSLQ